MRIGSYELLELLGRGGMGAVYRGRHVNGGPPVAVKVMTPELASDPVLLRRFEQEFEMAHRLQHPHIVQGLDFGVDEGKPFLVMEFVAGRSLGKRVREDGPLAQDEAVPIALQIADALELAHRQKLIHRDVKPENILVTPDDQAKLADLGLIKDLSAGGELTRTRTTLGTVVYMAPEQFEDARNADARCDVYGLAASLYYVLTGAAPFQGRGNLTIMAKKLKSDFPPPRRLVPTLAATVDAAICRSLQAEPAARPASCQEFAKLLTGPATASPSSSGVLEDVTEGMLEPPEERRVAPRYPCSLDAACAPLQGGLKQWRGEVLDISLTGVHLRLDRRFEPGTVLRIEVLDPELAVLATWLVRTRWVREVSTQRWSLGAAFNRALVPTELDAFLDALPPTVIVQERR